MKFLSTKATDMTVGQTLVYVLICTGLGFVPLIGALAYEKISERRSKSEED